MSDNTPHPEHDRKLGEQFVDMGLTPKAPQMSLADMHRNLAKQLYVQVYMQTYGGKENPHETHAEKAHKHAMAAVKNFNKMDWDK